MVRHRNGNVLLGMTTTSAEQDLSYGEPAPDGTFALFRSEEGYIEALSDYVASRTIWYYASKDWIGISTSQRMLVMALARFEPNADSARWMLTSGTLGHGNSWDKRLKPLPPGARLVHDRRSWTTKIHEAPPLRCKPTGMSALTEQRELGEAVAESVTSLKPSHERLTLALSGGMDSRSLLYHLQGRSDVDAVTWGTQRALRYPDSDASIRAKLAASGRLQHSYAEIDPAADFEKTVRRFLFAGEGRVDHLSGYLDGLQLWSRLASERRGLIRGYDAFGHKPPVIDEFQSRRASSVVVCEDLRNGSSLGEFGVTQEDIPETLSRASDETLDEWRDRLWLEYRTPVVTAALEEIKCAYVEVVNPLLFRRVVTTIQSLSAEAREQKRLFAQIVRDMYPGVPFARRDSTLHIDKVVHLPDARDFVQRTLRAHETASSLFEPSFLRGICAQPRSSGPRQLLQRQAKIFLRAAMPPSLYDWIRGRVRIDMLSPVRLAFRVALASETEQIFKADADASRQALALAGVARVGMGE
jgi:hypothetical protein